MLAFLALTLVAAQRPEMDFTPKWLPGDQWTARVTTKLQPDFPGDPSETYIFEETYRVRSVEDGVRRVEISRKLIESLLNELRLPPLPGTTAEVYDVTWKGSEPPLRDTLPKDSGQRRIWRLVSYIPPSRSVGIGKTWEVEFPQQPENALPKSSATWKLTGTTQFLDRVAAKLQYSFKEGNGTPPIEGAGDALVDHQTGILLQLKLKAANVLAPFGDGTPCNYTYDHTVTELKLKPRKSQ